MTLLLVGIAIGFLFDRVWAFVIEMYDLYVEERDNE